MKIPQKTLGLLKKHGFQWYKDHSTDRVDADCIADVIAAPDGLTVVYNDKSVFETSTATVNKVDLPDDLEGQWIRVHWDTIEDKRRKPKPEPVGPYSGLTKRELGMSGTVETDWY